LINYKEKRKNRRNLEQLFTRKKKIHPYFEAKRKNLSLIRKKHRQKRRRKALFIERSGEFP
jgi:hypothetical protein